MLPCQSLPASLGAALESISPQPEVVSNSRPRRSRTLSEEPGNKRPDFGLSVDVPSLRLVSTTAIVRLQGLGRLSWDLGSFAHLDQCLAHRQTTVATRTRNWEGNHCVPMTERMF